MADCVLDASAVLAMLGDEPGSAFVRDLISRSTISTVNLAEVAGKLADLAMPMPDVRGVLARLPCEIVEFDARLAYLAASLRPSTRHLGLSLGDRACLALAQHLGLPAITADRRWANVDKGVEVRLIRD